MTGYWRSLRSKTDSSWVCIVGRWRRSATSAGSRNAWVCQPQPVIGVRFRRWYRFLRTHRPKLLVDLVTRLASRSLGEGWQLEHDRKSREDSSHWMTDHGHLTSDFWLSHHWSRVTYHLFISDLSFSPIARDTERHARWSLRRRCRFHGGRRP